jgi:thiosulfate/3-mercaptopyruvate sulfurtransferase
VSNLLQIDKPLVSVNWLCENLNATNLVVLNGTLPKVTASNSTEIIEEFQIPNTRFFDLKKVFSVQGADFPNTVLPENDFENEAQKLGINKDSCIVVYDEYGIYSAPRVWWLFKSFGFENIAVLNGGFPEWKKEGFLVEQKSISHFSKGNFKSNYKSGLLVDSNLVLDSIEDSSIQILDARSAGRFNATAPEPRPEVRSGHMPNSKSLPYSSIISDGKMKSNKELKSLFNDVNSENRNMIFSCGSGITACVLALGATIAGYENLAVYDGSWTEWGSLSHLPIEK